MRVVLAIVVCLAMTSVASAQVELKNDSFQSGGQAGFQSGFVATEVGASRFVAPSAGRTLQKVVFLFGGAAATRDVVVHVYDDTPGTDTPGDELASAMFQLTAADAAFQQADVSAMNIVLPAQFRIGIELTAAGVPSIARDTDGTIAADRNFIRISGGQWRRAASLGVVGDWIIRAEVSAGSGPLTDAGVDPDAMMAGGPCTGNAQCPAGQYCDLNANMCTFDCTSAADCGGNTCNSRGQCAGLNDGGGGCGCRTGEGNGLEVVIGMFTVLLVLVRRR